MKKYFFFVSIALSGLLTACQSDDTDNPVIPSEEPVIEEPVENEYQPIELTAAETQLAAQSADFAFRLLQAADDKLPADQLYLSPLSASYALSMLANGADGDTRKELVDVLGFSGFTMDEINAYNQKLVTQLAEQDETAALGVANSLWMFDDFQVLDSYREVLASNYDADIRQVELSEAMETINAWCDEKTNGCIPEFLKGTPEGEMALLNALYFKGLWTNAFETKETKAAMFTNEDGSMSRINMMSNTGLFPYVEAGQYAVLSLPYGNEAFSLDVVLPDEGTSLSACMSSLDGAAWQSVKESMTQELVEVKLPKFTADNIENRLVEVLEAMGVQKLFGGEADMNKLAEKKLGSWNVMQTVYFALDEEGTEAAGVTGLIPDSDQGISWDGEEEPKIFRADRPFLFLLTEKSTGTVLFMGKVTEL